MNSANNLFCRALFIAVFKFLPTLYLCSQDIVADKYEVCLNLSPTVVFTNNAPTAGIDYFEWTFPDNSQVILQYTNQPILNISHDFNSLGSWDVVVRKIKFGGSPDPVKYTITILVYAVDDLSISLSAAIVCSGDALMNFTSNKNPSTPGRTVTWDFGDGSTGAGDNVSHLYSFMVDSVYTITMNVNNICGFASTTSTIRVYPNNPLIDIGSGTICRGNDINFTNANHIPEITYLWDFGDGNQSAISNPAHIFQNSGLYNTSVNTQILPPQGQGCNSTTTLNINVLPAPAPDFDMIYTPSCDSVSVSFSDQTDGITTSWDWDFGDGQTSTGQDPGTIHFDAAGTYNITLLATNGGNGCANDTTIPLYIPATPVSKFSADNVCEGQTAQFVDQSTVSIGTITGWAWNFGDNTGSILQNPQKTYNLGGNITVTLKVTSDSLCENTSSLILTVDPLPSAAITPLTINSCPPVIVNFNNSTTGAVNYLWNFDDGYTSLVHDTTYTYFNYSTSNDTFHVEMIASTAFGCKDTAYSSIIVFPSPRSQFTSDYGGIPECGPISFNFTSTSTGAQTYEWQFGDNTSASGTSVSHTYNNPNQYFMHFPVYLIASSNNGCTDTSEIQYITLYPLPQTNFFIDTIDNCQPVHLMFEAPNEANGFYSWDFGDNTTVTTNNKSQDHFFTNTGNTNLFRNIKLVTTSQFGCLDSTIKQVIIRTSPIADFSVIPPSVKNYPAAFGVNLPLQNTEWEYFWNFGENADTNAIYNPGNYLYQSWGNYTITLTIKDSSDCIDTAMHNVRIIAPPARVDFSMNPVSGCPPLDVIFTNLSINVDTTTYIWNFGDGSYSYNTDQSHTYFDEGEITVTLSANDLSGSTITKDSIIYVFDRPEANFEIIPEVVIVPDEPILCKPLFFDSTYSYHWDFGDDSTSNLANPLHYYQESNEYIITLIVTSPDGCSDTIQKGDELQTKAGGTLGFPNAFTPGLGGPIGSSGMGGGGGSDDGFGNGLFYPVLMEGVEEYTLQIYDRWGELLFSGTKEEIGWDGYYNGKICKQDVYIWKIVGTYSSGKNFIKAGTVTLIHDTNKK